MSSNTSGTLTILGGDPELDEQMFTIEHSLGDREIEAVRRVVGSRRPSAYGNAAEVFVFEDEFAEFVGTDHAVSVSSGTRALTVALRAAGVEPDDSSNAAAHAEVDIELPMHPLLEEEDIDRVVDILQKVGWGLQNT